MMASHRAALDGERGSPRLDLAVLADHASAHGFFLLVLLFASHLLESGYFRTHEQEVRGVVRGYHKPIMLAGGVGNVSAKHAHKAELPVGALLIRIAGPATLIDMGGGSASFMSTGAQEAIDRRRSFRSAASS